MSIPATHRTVVDVRATAPSIDVVSNAHSPDGRQWVLVIDDLHILEFHLRQTKQVVQEFLESLPAGDQVAIVFVGRSDLSQDFTSDLGAQMRTVNRIKDSLGSAHDSADVPPWTPPPDLFPDAHSLGGDAAQRERHRYGLSTVEVLKNVCDSLARSTYPRKALVYVSEGMTYKLDDTFPSDFMDFSTASTNATDIFDELKVIFEKAKRAGVPVYPIDPRGLPDCTSVRGPCERLPWEIIRAQMNNMRTLAENTGGLAFVGGSDLSRSIRELVEDNSSFYVLGYYPQPFDRDGKFHDVKVSVERPGARVRARAGYDSPKAAPDSVADTKKTLDEVLGASLPASGLSLRAFAAPVAAGLHGMNTAVTLEVTYPAPADGSKIADELQFGMVAIDRDGKIKATSHRAFHFTGSAGGAAEVTYAINDVIELPSQPLVLRVAVASQALGKAGAIHIPVEPIDPSRSELQLGAVVIGLDGPPRQAAMPPGALKDVVPFQPTTDRTFAETDTLRVFVVLFWSSKETSANVTLSVRRGDQVVAERQARATAAPGADSRHRAELTDVMPLRDLPAGRYVLSTTATLTGGRASTREIAFEVR